MELTHLRDNSHDHEECILHIGELPPQVLTGKSLKCFRTGKIMAVALLLNSSNEMLN